MKKNEVKKILRDIMNRVEHIEEYIEDNGIDEIIKDKGSYLGVEDQIIEKKKVEFPIDKLGWMEESSDIVGHYHLTEDGAYNICSNTEVDIHRCIKTNYSTKFYRVRIRIDKED